MILGLEHVDDVRAPGLRRLHDIGAGRIGLAVGGQRRGRLQDLDADEAQRVDELGGRRSVGLVGGNHVDARVAPRRILQHGGVGRERQAPSSAAAAPSACGGRVRRCLGGGHRRRCTTPPRTTPAAAASARRSVSRRRGRCHRGLETSHVFVRDGPVIVRSALDLVRPHLVDVVEELILVARRQVEHRVIGGDRVVDRLAEVPLLGLDRRRQIRARQDLAGGRRDLHRRRVADNFGQQADDVLEVGRGPQAAVPPG